MADPNPSERAPHDPAEELLPWYATGQLDAADRARVERHLYSCAECREQLGVERRLIAQFHTMTPEVDSGWARLKAQIAPPRPRQISPRQASFLADLKTIFARPAVAALAAAQVAVLAFGGLLLSLSQPVYQTLGSAPAPSAANVIAMFRADATEGKVHDALHAAGASIVGGPTETGAYLLHVEPQRRQAALAKLQTDGSVTLAQPIDGAGQ
jgi:anti-sigma-K factor RskA